MLLQTWSTAGGVPLLSHWHGVKGCSSLVQLQKHSSWHVSVTWLFSYISKHFASGMIGLWSLSVVFEMFYRIGWPLLIFKYSLSVAWCWFTCFYLLPETFKCVLHLRIRPFPVSGKAEVNSRLALLSSMKTSWNCWAELGSSHKTHHLSVTADPGCWDV